MRFTIYLKKLATPAIIIGAIVMFAVGWTLIMLDELVEITKQRRDNKKNAN